MGVSKTAPAVLTVEQMEELAKLLVPPPGTFFTHNTLRDIEAKEWLWNNREAIAETARAYHRLVGALETLGFTRPDEMIQQARDRGWKDPQ